MRAIAILILCFLMVGGLSLNAQQQQPTEEVVTIATKYGTIAMVLFDDAPLHKQNFLKLAKAGFYNGSTFHRVIDGFMIQGGDYATNPNNDGSMVKDENGREKTLAAEINNKYYHSKGVLAAARLGDAVNPEFRSSPCQFYIVENEWGAHFLDGKYTIFGIVIEGLDVVEKIAAQPTSAADKPVEDIRMEVTVATLTHQQIKQQYAYVVK